MQIIQFVIDIFVVYFGSTRYSWSFHEYGRLISSPTAYSHHAYLYYPELPVLGNCVGAESSAWFGCGLLTSYLGLFINFYIQTYKAPVKSGKKHVNGVANGNGYVLITVSSHLYLDPIF